MGDTGLTKLSKQKGAHLPSIIPWSATCPRLRGDCRTLLWVSVQSSSLVPASPRPTLSSFLADLQRMATVMA